MPNTPRMQWPFPSENQDPWFDGMESYFIAADASGYAGRENDQLVLSGGGDVSFNASVVGWTENIDIFAAYTGYKWTIEGPSQFTLEDGQIAYVTLTRAPSRNLTITPVVSYQLPVGDNTVVFAVRNGSAVYFRNGSSVEAGTSITPITGSNVAATTGEANTASNQGVGLEVFKQKTGIDLEFRTLLAGYNLAGAENLNDVTFTENTTVVTLVSSGGNILINAATGSKYEVELDEITTVLNNPTNLAEGQHFEIVIKQDSTGGRLLTFGTNWIKTDGITSGIAMAADAVTILRADARDLPNGPGLRVYFTLEHSEEVGSSGEANTASNLGTGAGVFESKVGVDLRLRSIIGGYNTTHTENANDITVAEDLTVTTLVSAGGNIPIDAAVGSKYDVELTEATTELNNPTNLAEGQHFEIHIKQDGTGSRLLTFGTNWLSIDGITTEVNPDADSVTVLRGHARNLPNGPGLRIYYTMEHANDTGAGPPGIVTLTSTSNQVAIDASLGTEFKLNNLGEDTEIQIPTNASEGMHLTVTIEQDGTGERVVTWAAGYQNAGQLVEVSLDADRVSIIDLIARDYGSGLVWSYKISHAEFIVGLTDIDVSAQTTDATVTTIATFATTTDDAIYLVDASFLGIDKTANHGYERGMRALVLRDETSTLSLLNVNNYSTYDTDDPTWDATCAVSGTNILLRVQGDATNAVEWHVKGVVKEHF